MYTDYNQLTQYDQHLREKAQEYQNTQYDMGAFLKLLATCANAIVTLLVPRTRKFTEMHPAHIACAGNNTIDIFQKE